MKLRSCPFLENSFLLSESVVDAERPGLQLIIQNADLHKTECFLTVIAFQFMISLHS